MPELDWHVCGATPTVRTPFFTDTELADVRRWYAAAGQPVTPLRELPGRAAELGLGALYVKDETSRQGLPAFKIAGAQYAIARLMENPRPPTVLACATAGNHGQAVARAGREHGLEVQVYVPIGTLPAAVEAIRAEGAHVVVTSWDYDQTVRIMASDAAESGWTVVSDTGWSGYEEIPRAIMAGYTRILDEAAAEWPVTPDAIVVQAGVGSLAGAVAGWLQATPACRARLAIAEPVGSACVLASLRAGHRVTLSDCAPTEMAGLRCAAVSPVAWPPLQAVARAAVAVPDTAVAAARSRLTHPTDRDPSIPAGPSGACGLAAVDAIMRRPELEEVRATLALGPGSRVLIVVTEGVAIRQATPHAERSAEVV